MKFNSQYVPPGKKISYNPGDFSTNFILQMMMLQLFFFIMMFLKIKQLLPDWMINLLNLILIYPRFNL
jgi:hypothetical protein